MVICHYSCLKKMEIQFSINYTNYILLLSSILFLYNVCKKLTKRSQRLPPSPWKLPIIGHLHHIGTLPHRSFQQLANKHGPLVHLKLGQVTTIVVSSPTLAKEVLKVHDPAFADRPQSIAGEILWYSSSNISFSQYGEYWRQMRKICIRQLFSAKSVKSFSSIRNDEVSHLIESIKASSGAPVDLTQLVFSTISSITCRAAFGKVCRDKDQLIDMFKEGITLVSGFDLSDLYPSWKILKALSCNRRRLLKLVIKEGLRLHAPIPLIPRVSREETIIASYVIPFGAGRRMCPGMAFGLASVELPLVHLLYNFDWKLPEGMSRGDLDMIERPAITAARRQNLELVATPYDRTLQIDREHWM